MPRSRKNAFTLIELLVVVAIIALLISILLPSLQGAREQGKRAVCLSNMKAIAGASHSYASDDPREMLIPLHKLNFIIDHATGFNGQWSWRTALPFAYGGRTPTKKMISQGQAIQIMQDDWKWGAPTRPLNRYIYGDVSEGEFDNMPMFHCPSDTGYVELDPDLWPEFDAPPSSAGIPCYDFVGNSFRINTCGLIWAGGNSPLYRGDMSVGARGHGAAQIENPSRVAMYCEPLFYWWSRQDPATTVNPELLMVPGWHGKIMSDDVAYCDGSARTTKVDELAEWDEETLDLMGVTEDVEPHYFLRRGRTWQTDCYPSPGAVIRVYSQAGTPLLQTSEIDGYSGWPFDNYTLNTAPF